MTAGRIVCFGELLLRLAAPGAERLLQSARLDICVGGAEANVAVSLACLGLEAAIVSIAPDNALGHAAADELRRHGVDVSGVRFTPGRMGLYFLAPGAVLRPSQVTYDRAGSAFAVAAPDAVDWDQALAGASWLHVSGVTPAIGQQAADAAVRAVREAKRLGLSVSFDGNFRGTMWATWNGDAPGILRQIFECADIAFADERDIGLILGGDYGQGSTVERRQRAAEAVFAAFPNLKRLAATIRTHHGVDRQDLSATLITPERLIETKAYPLAGIVDRIGGGDAFAAGVLHGLVTGASDQDALEFGLAAAALKHSIPGDFNLVSAAEVRALLAGDGIDVKR